jgi:hypothetical protein
LAENALVPHRTNAMRVPISPGEEQRLVVLKAVLAMRAGYAVNTPDGISEGRWQAMLKHMRREWARGGIAPFCEHIELPMFRRG